VRATGIALVLGLGLCGAVLLVYLAPGGYAGILPVTAGILFFAACLALGQARFLRKRISAAEESYKSVFNGVPEPIFVFDARTKRCLDANDAALAQAGVSRDEIRGLNGFAFASPESTYRVLDWIRESLGSAPKSAVHHIIARDGQELFLEIAVGRGRLDERDAIVVSYKDRTASMRLEEERAERLEAEVKRRTEDLERANRELRELQTRLIEAERLGTAGAMAGGIAHAIYNPLTVLIGTVQMRMEASRRVDPHDEMILRLAQRVVAIVEGMLTLSRRGCMHLEDVTPARLVADLREELAERCRSQGVEIVEWLDSELPEILVDRALMTAALARIAENAVEAMNSGGKLSLAVERVPGADVVGFRIRDSGPGIRPDLQSQIFQPFFTTKPSGTGLGLAIARGIIHGHEGSLRLTSEEGAGTEVIVEIPRRGLRGSLSGREAR
jgi:PAS domain S-box-containing protein